MNADKGFVGFAIPVGIEPLRLFDDRAPRIMKHTETFIRVYPRSSAFICLGGVTSKGKGFGTANERR